MNVIQPSEETIADLPHCVARTLREDLGCGDITAALISPQKQSTAMVICREKAVICGRPWVDEVFAQLDPHIAITWHVEEGDEVAPQQEIFTVTGNTRLLLSGERSALNFLQTLSATATTARQYASMTDELNLKVLDTRKTLPGLRLAQKYAVCVGGCYNHRIGLYDAFLVKENHILACGGIAQAVVKARQLAPERIIEVEVESIDELIQAVGAGVDTVMLDNFSTDELHQLYDLDLGATKIEVSGNITLESIQQYSNSPIDYISSGALTKHIRAIDLSMRLLD